MKAEVRKTKGITLVALVVTIVILLILAGVSLNLIIGNNGLIQKAKDAKAQTEKAQDDENKKLGNYGNLIDDYVNSTYEPIEDINDEIDGLPQKKTEEQLAGYIPIYTKEQLAKVATGETCEITDTKGVSKGTYTMAVDAKYALMNDLDFQNESSKPIKNFKGEFEGNGCTITNMNIDTTSDSFNHPINGNKEGAPAGLFECITDGKVSNLAITDSTFNTIESIGAIAGQGNNAIVENCYSKNNVFIGNSDRLKSATGGIIGFAWENGITINNCKTIYVETSKNNSAGICGGSAGNANISNCKVLGDKTKESILYAGIINCAGANVNIENCSSQDVNVKYAGILAIASETLIQENTDVIYNINVNNCSAKNVTTQHAGIVHDVAEKRELNVLGCKVENLTLVDGDDGRDGAAIVNIIECNIATIKNCTVKGFHLLTKAEAGGIINDYVTRYYNNPGEKNLIIQNCNIEDIEFKETEAFGGIVRCATAGNVKIENCKVEKVVGNCGSIGGIISTPCNGSSRQIEINNCSVENIKLSGNNFGGIVGCSTIENIKIENCTVKEVEGKFDGSAGGITQNCVSDNEGNLIIKGCNVENMKLNVGNDFGGIIRCIDGNMTAKVEYCTVNNVDGKANRTSNAAGGIVGLVTRSANKTSEITNCSVNNSNIEGKYNTGGILGCGDVAQINNCTVINSKVINNSPSNLVFANNGGIVGVLNKGTIIECITRNVEVESTISKTGGILGGTYDNCASVENSNVYGGYIRSENTEQGIGGICGFGTNVSNCKVEGLEINAPNTDGVGGIVGHGMNNVSTSLIQKSSVKNCKITGKNYVGGITGAAFINIADCQVDGTTITGNDSVGGIQGFGGKFEDATKYVPIRIDKGEVTNTEINGTTNVNNIQGKNTYIIDSSEPTKDTIINCKYNGNLAEQ